MSEESRGRLIPEAKEAVADIRDLLADFADDYDQHKARGYIEIETSGLFRRICPYFRIKLK